MKRFTLLLFLCLGVAFSQKTSQPPSPGIMWVSALPAACRVGQVAFLTVGTVGLYGCTATNTWTLGAGAASASTLTATASGFSLPAANFPTLTEVTGTNTIYKVLGYPDADGDFSAQFSFPLPTFTTISATIRWHPAAAATGSVVWQVATACAAAGEAPDPAFNAVQTVTSAAPAATELTDATIASLTTTGCAAGEQMWVKVLRNRTHASDSLNQIPYLYTAKLAFN